MSLPDLAASSNAALADLATSVARRSAALDRLPPYVFAELDRLKQAARAGGRAFLDLGIGSPDQPMATPLVAELQRAALDPATHGYPPFRALPRLQESVGRFMQARFGVEVEPAREVLALAGSKEGIAQLVFAATGPGDVVLVPEVYYPVYARAAFLAGADVHWLPTTAATGFLADFESVPDAVARRARLLILNYPNNPTGATAEPEYFARAVAFARERGIILASDLAYSELGFDGYVAPSALQAEGARDVTIEFHSCSKSFNMAGLRAGFAVGSAALVELLAAYRTNVGYGAPTVVQHAASLALDDHAAHARPVAAAYQARRDAAVAALRELGWPVTPPRAAMYLWLPVPAQTDDWTFVRALLEEGGVVVTPGSAFGPGGAGWFRVSLVAEPAALREAVARIGEVCARRGWTA